jgi:hypothetical protein
MPGGGEAAELAADDEGSEMGRISMRVVLDSPGTAPLLGPEDGFRKRVRKRVFEGPPTKEAAAPCWELEETSAEEK